MKNIVIFGGARDYHVMDWYRTIRSLVKDRDVTFLTDLIGGEGFNVIIDNQDNIKRLLIIDKFLFSKQSYYGDKWRNILKILVLPYQIYLLKKYFKNNKNSIFHAQPMYYMFLCWLSKIEFIGTPQGSEILVRPFKSKIYKYFAVKVLRAAKIITVDSHLMKDKIYELSKKQSFVIQNGIDINSIDKLKNNYKESKKDICSMRGFTPLYQIDKIVNARNNSSNKFNIKFIYPFYEHSYKSEVIEKFENGDEDLGRLNRIEMYKLFLSSKLIISIPLSDSSPRSVYEAIFCGSCIAAVYNPWIEKLPDCMKQRIYIVDLNNKNWFEEAVKFSENNKENVYHPSQEAIDMFDENKTMMDAIDKLYS